LALSEVYNMDCIVGMKEYPDNYFDLAIVDPPYAWGNDMFLNRPTSSKRKNKLGIKYQLKDWNKNVPCERYWKELFRVSKNQIVWGGNYFDLPISRGWIFWDKLYEKTHTFSHGELAWTSFDVILRKVTKSSKAETKGGKNKIHINQKPVCLYKWLLDNYASKGDKIIDTHLGSGSSRIASYQLGFDFVGFEIDEDYFNAQEERYKTASAQIPLIF